MNSPRFKHNRRSRCVIKTCGHVQVKNPNCSYTKFPSDRKRCIEWLKAIGDKDLLRYPISFLNKNRFVCGCHFKESINNVLEKYRKGTAVPSIFKTTVVPLTDDDFKNFTPLSTDEEDTNAEANRIIRVMQQNGSVTEYIVQSSGIARAVQSLNYCLPLDHDYTTLRLQSDDRSSCARHVKDNPMIRNQQSPAGTHANKFPSEPPRLLAFPKPRAYRPSIATKRITPKKQLEENGMTITKETLAIAGYYRRIIALRDKQIKFQAHRIAMLKNKVKEQEEKLKICSTQHEI